MALHCALTSGGVRDLRRLVQRLHTARDPLRIGDLYRFQITAGGKILLDGRASVFLKHTEESS